MKPRDSDVLGRYTAPAAPVQGEELLIEMGIGWKRDPKKPGSLVSADIKDYVAEIERLRSSMHSEETNSAYQRIDELEAALATMSQILKAVDYTLTVHGHIDRETPLHDRVTAGIFEPFPAESGAHSK